jgi:large subunit ribosomal protein L10
LGLNLEQKQAVVAEVSAEVAKAQAIVLAEYRGLAVGNMTELRKRARNSGVFLRVLKNTLARRAVSDTPFAGLTEKMIGPLFYGISSDPVAVAKVLHEFSRENVEKFVIKGGAMPNVVMSPQQVADLARMPSREQLLAMLLGTMQAPIAKLARTLNEVPGKFVRTLAAIQEQKEKQAA